MSIHNNKIINDRYSIVNYKDDINNHNDMYNNTIISFFLNKNKADIIFNLRKRISSIEDGLNLFLPSIRNIEQGFAEIRNNMEFDISSDSYKLNKEIRECITTLNKYVKEMENERNFLVDELGIILSSIYLNK